MADHSPSGPQAADLLLPRRFKYNAQSEWCGRPAGTMLFGCYFPATDLCVVATGRPCTGIPQWPGIEWIDSLDDISWAPKPAEGPRDEQKKPAGIVHIPEECGAKGEWKLGDPECTCPGKPAEVG